MNFDSYEGLLTHLIQVHKICRKFYETSPALPSSNQPQVDVTPPDIQVPEVNLIDASDVSQFLQS